MSTLTLAQKTPTDIEVDMKQREVRIIWGDDVQSVFTFDHLRKICPCATCNEQRANHDPLRILKADQLVVSANLPEDNPVEMVGNYALQFFWGDGHRTGIYTFQFLREQSS